MLTAELQASPPRDTRAAAPLLTKGGNKIRGMLVGGAVLPVLVVLLLWLRYGSIDSLGIGLAIGIGALVELVALALLAQRNRAVRLFRDGIATIGKVCRMETPSDPRGAAYIIAHIEFQDKAGTVRVGQITTLGHKSAVDRREGDQVDVLYLENEPSKFAIFTPGLGIVPGIVRG